MRYTKFEIENYKGIQEKLIIDLDQKPAVNILTFVGLNESGKSSILEAINLLNKQVPDNEAHQLIHKSKKSNYTGEVKISAHMELDAEDKKRIETFCKKELDFRLTKDIKSIIISARYSFKNSEFVSYISHWDIPLIGTEGRGKKEGHLYTKNKPKWSKLVKFLKNNFPKILYYKDFLFDFPQKIYLEELENESFEQSEYRKVFQDILDSFDNGLTIEDHFLHRLQKPSEQNQESLDALTNQIGHKLSITIFKNWEQIFTKSNKEIELNCKKDEHGFYIEMKIKQGIDRYHINERSLGFRWFFSFLLFTEFRKARQDDFGETLFLLDEPASNLHQKAQQKLLALFESIANKSKIIYSTHSHHLINPKYLSGTYIVKNNAINYDNETDFNTNITDVKATLYKSFVSKYPHEEDHFKPILDAIDYLPSSLENVPNIVCLEGKNDYYTLRFFQDVIFKESGYSFNFFPGASVDKFDQLFRLYIAWNKNFFALFDDDKAGNDAKNRYIKEIGVDLKERIYVLNDIDESFKGFSAEDLFDKDDKLKVIQQTFSGEVKYGKSKFNTALQDIYINKKPIDFSKKTLSNFQKVFDFFVEKQLSLL